MSQQIASDVYGILRGLQKVTNESFKYKQKHVQRLWSNSSVKSLAEDTASGLSKSLRNLNKNETVASNVSFFSTEALQRSSMVFEGIKALTNFVQSPRDGGIQSSDFEADIPPEFKIPFESIDQQDVKFTTDGDLVISDIAKQKQISTQFTEPVFSNSPTSSFTNVAMADDKTVANAPLFVPVPPKPLGGKQTIPQLVPTAKARKVPSTRIGRMISFGGLFAGLGVGTVAELTRRTLGVNESLTDNPFLTPANVERIVSTMCKVRGAALKIGQLLSIQDSEIIPPALQVAFERVRQSADFMPTSQVEGVLKRELGSDWRQRFVEFDMKPFAAASIGQVHWGKLEDGTEVAVKIQYPGVAAGINSDIENLVSVLNIWNVFPPGMFIDKLVEVAKKELSWEVDYLREAECTRQFKKLLEPFTDYYVPRVIDDLCTSQVFTSELIEGFPVDKAAEVDTETRNRICSLIMHLCLKELFEFRYMQTDPNWSNFFYNQKTKQLVLLDFGATRSYDKLFMDNYLEVIKAAADEDRGRVLSLSQKMGFLTGYESKVMEEAHIDTVMILGEVFSESAGVFDFGGQKTVRRVTKNVPTMLTHRLCPPPEEIYSIHRKISGVFLLCSKLKVKIACRSMLIDIYNKYEFGNV